MIPVRTVAPAADALALADVKTHLRVHHDDDDALITLYRDAAVTRLDGYAGVLGRCLINQTWRIDLADWPRGDRIRLPFPDVSSITSIKYSDTLGVEQTLPSTHYTLTTDARSSLVWLRDAFAAPSLDDDRPDPVRVLFVAGFGAGAADVPASIKAALLLMIGDLYEQRENTVVGQASVSELPLSVKHLLAPYRHVGI